MVTRGTTYLIPNYIVPVVVIKSAFHYNLWVGRSIYYH